MGNGIHEFSSICLGARRGQRFSSLIFNEISLIALFMHKLSSRLSKTAEQRLDGEGLVRHHSGVELFLKSPASCRLNDFSVNVVRRGSAIMPESSFFAIKMANVERAE
jgi:hypothetical protein